MKIISFELVKLTKSLLIYARGGHTDAITMFKVLVAIGARIKIWIQIGKDTIQVPL